MDIFGLDAAGAKIFEYRYASLNCQDAWNAIPVHLEHVNFWQFASCQSPGKE
jgi:hypothetical protein